MKVSIITVCFNRASTIRDCIESVLGQDYPDIEYIVVDGASSDGTCDVAGEYRDRLAVLVSEPDSGMYDAINKGLLMAGGDIVGLLHSDDMFYSPQTVRRIVESFSQTGADFLYGDGVFVSPTDSSKVVRKWIGGAYRLWKVRNGWLPLHPTCYIRRDVMLRKGFYNAAYKIAADTDFLLRYLLSGELHVFYLKEFIVRMRMGGLSTSSKRRSEMWDEDVRIYNSHGLSPLFSKIEKVTWKIPQFVRARLRL